MSKYMPEEYFDEDADYARKSKKKESPRRRPDRNQKRSWDELDETPAPIQIPLRRRK